MTDEKFFAIDYESMRTFLLHQSEFEVALSGGDSVTDFKCGAFAAEIVLRGLHIDDNTIRIADIHGDDRGVTLTLEGSDKMFEAEADSIEGKLQIYDLRPVDTDISFEVVSEWLSEARNIADLFGEKVLTEEEREAVAASALFDLLRYPWLIEVTDDKQLETSVNCLKGINNSLADSLSLCLSADRRAVRSRAFSNFLKAAGRNGLKRILTERYLAVCNKVNDNRAANPYVDFDKYKVLSASAEKAALKNGYTGVYPHFTKGRVYIDFSLGYSIYENEGTEYHYDLAASFGVRGEKPKKFRSAVTGSDRLILDIMKKYSSADEYASALDAVFSSAEKLADGKDADPGFLSLAQPGQYDRSWTPMLTALGGIGGAFGWFMSVMLLIFGDLNGFVDFAVCTIMLALFTVLLGKVYYFGFYLKKHCKFLYREKEKNK